MQQAETDIEMTVYTGDLSDAVRIASQYTGNDYDFIDFRGGNAQMIRDAVDIPVAEIEAITLGSAALYSGVQPKCICITH